MPKVVQYAFAVVNVAEGVIIAYMVCESVDYEPCPVLTRYVSGYVEDVKLKWGGVSKPCVHPSVRETAITIVDR